MARRKTVGRLCCLFSESGSFKRLFTCSRVESVADKSSDNALGSEKVDFGRSASKVFHGLFSSRSGRNLSERR